MLASLKYLKSPSLPNAAPRGRYSSRINRHYSSQEAKQTETEPKANFPAHLYDLEETVAHQFAQDGTILHLFTIYHLDGHQKRHWRAISSFDI